MKTGIIKISIFVLILSQFTFKSAFAQVGLYEELMSLSSVDQLPRFRDNSVIHQISSYDTTGGNDDGFSGKFSYVRKEGDNLVIADLKGPGVIHRIWTPTPSEDVMEFYFDGENTPGISLKFIDLFTGKIYPFSRPVVGNEVGGYYCYVPIPYKNSCKIIYKGKLMRFIQIDYREFTDQTAVTSFPAKLSEKENGALALAVKTWSTYGKGVVDLLPLKNEIKSKTLSVSLKPGDTAPIFQDKKGGRIIGIEITPQSDLNNKIKDLILKASWDNDKVPGIICPVSDFFGYGFGKPAMQSMLLGVNDRLHYCYIPMPYDKRASLELMYLKNELNTLSDITCNVTIYYKEQALAKNEGRFYAKWRRETNPETGKPYTILDAEGKGHYIGTILQSQGRNPGITTFFEGDDEGYIDGKLALHGTGSEDFFNGGWYALPDRWDQGFSLPVHGSLAYSIPLARTGAYRFYFPDKTTFSKSYLLTIEHGPAGNNIPVDYSSVAFYYCDKAPSENSIPPVELLKKIESPKMMEYWLALLPINAFSSRGVITNERMSAGGKNFDVFKYTARENSFIKFELEVPENGNYKLYMSYFKGPECADFQLFQRQIPLSEVIDATAEENTFVDKQLIGPVSIKEGTNTVTVVIKENGGPSGNKSFSMHRLFLERE